MIDPGTVLNSMNLAIDLAKFCLDLDGASEESRISCMLINRVYQDHDEAIRERRDESSILQLYPGKKAWIDEAIRDIEEVLVMIGRLVEKARVDGEGGKSMRLVHRFEWVLNNRKEFLSKKTVLDTCHASLLTAPNWMHMTIEKMPEVVPPPYYQSRSSSADKPATGLLNSPSARRSRRKLQCVVTVAPLDLTSGINFSQDQAQQTISSLQATEKERTEDDLMSQTHDLFPVLESWRVTDAPESITSGGSLIPAAMHTVEAPEENSVESQSTGQYLPATSGLSIRQERHLRRLRRFGLGPSLDEP